METISSSAGFLPLWILGAPLIAGLISMFTTPKPDSTRAGERWVAQPARM